MRRISRVCLQAQKSRFASRFEQNSLIHRLSEMGPVAALVDSDRLQLRRPFERQIDPVEQRLGTKISRLTSLADHFDDSGCYEGQTREPLNVARRYLLPPRDVGQGAHLSGGKLFKPPPRTRHLSLLIIRYAL
jgi:hypothetical protein